MTELKEIKKRIARLNFKEKTYENIELTYEQQTYERGKPIKYLEMTIELFDAIGGRSIVEIGCMRTLLTHPISEMHPECCNDGHSTYFWCTTGANVISVDIDRKAVSQARKSCKGFKNCKILRKDAIKFLEKFKGKIDLLFLDAWDVIPNTPYAENHLLAYLKVKDKLSRTNIISIDDTDVGGGGKGRLLIPVLKADGYQILVQGRQTITLKE
ncbi:MAG: methyltransferase domain-containing protein [Candidatus Marinimicrobia bacterium]|nr:methyltransferase domain-containing protein [Candidatus Neomarinimicrobiota bacterium]